MGFEERIRCAGWFEVWFKKSRGFETVRIEANGQRLPVNQDFGFRFRSINFGELAENGD